MQDRMHNLAQFSSPCALLSNIFSTVSLVAFTVASLQQSREHLVFLAIYISDLMLCISRSVLSSMDRPGIVHSQLLPVSQLVYEHDHTQQSSNVVALPQIPIQANHAGVVIAKIEAIFESMLEALSSNANQLSIPYRSRTANRGSAARRDGVITFPGRTKQEARKFAQLLRIIQISREALVSGSPVTKRNIFYRYKELFRNQRMVDILVDDLAYTLGVGRESLNVVAAAKGLLAGSITLTMRNSSVVACGLVHESGVLIPNPAMVRAIDFGSTRWVLVIEKEATFRTLAAAGYHRTSLAGHGVMLTGKGFPDLVTRSFLHIVHSIRPQLPIYALVDYDPDGISIMRTYRTGGRSLGHEENINTHQLQWLGIRSRDLLSRQNIDGPHHSQRRGSCDTLQLNSTLSRHSSISRSFSGGSWSQWQGSQDRTSPDPTNSQPPPRIESSPQGSLTPLTIRDRKAAVSLLSRIYDNEGGNDADDMEEIQELQAMLMLNIKAEIQAVDNLGDMTEWLDRKLVV